MKNKVSLPRNPVAKHFNSTCKPSIIAHKKRSKQMDAEMLEMEEDASESITKASRVMDELVSYSQELGLYEGFDTDEDKCLNDIGCSSISIDRGED